ncbi:MAG: hypothetical protein LBS96_09505 [Oscillospiraceae bacterium]|jgi:nicotinamidase-related amidase|nr:hypothetical protein [Oscillospiraceae bacterium]
MQYEFTLHSANLAYEDGLRVWQGNDRKAQFRPEEIAIVVVDMWDRHWSAGATRRAAALAPQMDAILRRARQDGALIIHAPSDCMEFYADHPARKRALALAPLPLPNVVEVPDVPAPVDAGDGGSDSERDDFEANTNVWVRQNPAIFIDEARDLISDNGELVYAHLRARGIALVLYVGVHTNMCILGRSFAIKAMRRAGLQTALVCDLTDAMYNPARPPYVSHAEGTRLVIAHIEKFYCPTITSDQL